MAKSLGFLVAWRSPMSDSINKAGDRPQQLAGKRPYRQPKLQVFGKVLHLTQGKGKGGGGKGKGSHHHHGK
jgi:hypothetical protein